MTRDKSAPGRGPARAQRTGNDRDALPGLVAELVAAYYRKDYAAILPHLTEDCVFIGAGDDVAFGLRELAGALPGADDVPSYLVRDARFELVSAGSPEEAIVAGFYTVYSDVEHRMISSERQRITVNCRLIGGAWKAYLVHSSNEWAPVGDAVAFPYDVNMQTYRYVQRILKASRTRADGGERVELPAEGSTVTVNPALVVYASASRKTTDLHLANRTVTVKMLLSSVEERLGSDFVRVHRSYLVNRNHVTQLDPGWLTLSTGEKIPVPKRRRREVEHALLADRA